MPTDSKRSPRLAALLAAWTLAIGAGALAPAADAEVLTVGPDVTVVNLPDITNWGVSGGIRAYSVGTTSCNIGDKPVAWCDAGTCLSGTLQSNDHPVIAQGLYRLKDGRFSQIGMSWLKHGWLSTNSGGSSSGCGPGSCTAPPGGGDQLGIGCTDTYNSGLNGGTGNPGTCAGGGGCRLGARSEVNPTTGDFPMPYTNFPHPSAIDQRIQVPETDVDPALNSGALYWLEGQYLAADDGLAGNAYNNASYRRVTVGASSPFNLSFSGGTVQQNTALQAWKTIDAAVETFNADFCSAPVERFEVARKVTVVDADTWHYEYAVRNMNSDHAAQRFAVDLPDGTPIGNVGFKDIDHHSTEIYSTTDWTSSIDAPNGTVSWSTETFAANNNANALRYATLFNFWFDADAAPATAQHSIDLFKPLPEAVANAGSDVSTCPGVPVQIGTAAVVGQTYSWAPGGATTAQINVSPLATTVYTVTATNRCDSSQDTVTVTVDEAPAAPALTSPADGSTGLLPPVNLAWNAVAGASDYSVQVATDAGFTAIVQSSTVAATGTPVLGLPAGTYFWRVTANGACAGATSTAFTFSVASGIFNDGFELGNTNEWSATVP